MNLDMDRRSFDSLLAVMDLWSNTADRVNDHGTTLIGHGPSIAPSAYRHVVYAGLSAERHEEFQSRAGRWYAFECRSQRDTMLAGGW